MFFGTSMDEVPQDGSILEKEENAKLELFKFLRVTNVCRRS
jgi:hypothetical protein